MRDRNHEGPAREAHHPLDIAFIVPVRRTTEPIFKQVVRLQRLEHPAALARPVAEDLRDRQLRIVIEDRQRRAAKEPERLDMPVAEGFRRLRVIRLHEHRVARRQAHYEEPNLPLNTAQNCDSLAEVRLGVPGWMRKRDERLLQMLAAGPNIIADRRVAPFKTPLVAEPLEDPLDRVTLLLRLRLILKQDLIDEGGMLIHPASGAR